ncbi:MAG: hypothetical protein RLZZ179_2202 [Verrucomicrobiota bacterium]|jgi:DNA repair protein RecN (Recombination protein N)
MLASLSLRNLALVESLTWELGRGLVCVTGETGAGKSIIVGALKLVLGERADRDLIRTGADQCSIEAVFAPADTSTIDAVLAAAGLDPCEGGQLIIRRVISASGPSRQFVNCTPATLQVLKALGQHLVDLHGPHEHQSLNSRDRQLTMLDAAATAESALGTYSEAWRTWRSIAQELDDLNRTEQAGERELELLRFQLEEIDSAAPRRDEEEPLLQRHRIAANSSKLADLTGQALGLLSEGDSTILGQLGELRRVFRDLERTDRSTAEITAPFETAFMELEDLERSLRRYQENLETNPREIAELEDRINLLESLKRKYGGSIERVLDHRDATAAKLSRMEDRSGELERLATALAAARSRVDAAASTLSQLRRKAAPRLAREVSRHLADLGFREAKFTVDLHPLPQPGAHGTEEAEFMFAPNPGEPAKPLRVIASSGEMSRVMLAVKSALAAEDDIPLLVFDEIDANVGGEIAAAVGRKMRELGASHQIISITHMPQVAALASSHYLVSKVVSDGRTHSELTLVEGDDRISEITRMLGGRAASARAHAVSLLAGGD